MRLQGKTAVVTGGASGFGRAMAQHFVREGARVVIADLDGEGAEAAAAEIGDGALALRADVAVRADAEAMVARAVEAFGRLDVMVNNAGFTHDNRPMLEVDEATFDRVYAVNVKAIYLAALACVPVMRAQGGGVILNTASTAGLRPRPGLTWYNGSKGAAITLTKSMAVELAPDRIRVNAICPVIGVTGMLEQFMGQPDSAEARAKFVATIPLGRMSEPDDIAAAAVYLACDEAAMLTGVALQVDGGRCI